MTLLVSDYDEAIRFYVDKLGFTLMCDEPVADGIRWVRLSPNDKGESSIVLLKAAAESAARVGDQAAGQVMGLLETDDFWPCYRAMLAAEVEFCEQPREEPYATVVVFRDLYGNKWDLLQPK